MTNGASNVKLDKVIITVLLVTCISQSLLGLFDPIESRQSIGELVAHNKGLVVNFPDGGTDCGSQSEFSSGMSFPELGGCWHYRSRYIFGELTWTTAGLIGDNYPAMKSFSLLVSIIEILVIYSFISKYFGNSKGALAAISYASIPAFIYYAQAPMIGHLKIIIVLLTARYSIPHFVDLGNASESHEGKGRHKSTELMAWSLVLIGPAFDTFLAFAWAGFGLTLAIFRFKGQKSSIPAIGSFFLAPVFWFYFSYKANQIFGYGNEFASRFNARSDFSLFFNLEFYVEFLDSFSNQTGPIGLLLLFMLFINAGGILKLDIAPMGAVLALTSMLFFSLFFFQSTFIDCCAYLAYPVVALSCFGVIGIRLERPEFIAAFSILILVSFIGGLELHGVENNYSERPLQKYVIEEIEVDDGMVVTDHLIAEWNAYRWQIPGGTIHISEDYQSDEFYRLVSTLEPEHIILSNQTFHHLSVESIGESMDYCIREIETDERIPNHWIEGWMSDVYPIRAIWRC